MRLFYWKKWEKYQISPIAIAGLINVASLTKSHQEGNSEGEYLHVQAFGFRDIKFPAVIFRPKKRSGIAVRVAERFGTWQAKRPTTHNTRSMKNLPGDILPRYDIPMGHATRSFPNKIFFLSHQGIPQTGTRAALAPNSAYYSFSFAVCVPSLRFASVFRVVPAVFPRLVAAVRTLPPFSAFGLWCVVPASPSVFPIFRPTLFPLAVKHDDT